MCESVVVSERVCVRESVCVGERVFESGGMYHIDISYREYVQNPRIIEVII